VSQIGNPPTKTRVVFDTNTIISTLLYRRGRLAWLRKFWSESRCVPLLSRATASELTRVLSYSKFRLTLEQRLELLGFYLPYCQTIEKIEPCTIVCRDEKDQIFLDLAESGRADVLVTGDLDLLTLAGQTRCLIETPEVYRQRV